MLHTLKIKHNASIRPQNDCAIVGNTHGTNCRKIHGACVRHVFARVCWEKGKGVDGK